MLNLLTIANFNKKKKKKKKNPEYLKKHLTTYLLYLYEQSYYCANNELPQESDGCISGSHSQ